MATQQKTVNRPKSGSAGESRTTGKGGINFRPMEDRVLVEPLEAEQMTAGGIVLPDSAREKPQQGTVIAVGPGKLLDSGNRGEMSVRNGDVVFYGKYAGTEIEHGGEKYYVIRENDILAVVDN